MRPNSLQDRSKSAQVRPKSFEIIENVERKACRHLKQCTSWPCASTRFHIFSMSCPRIKSDSGLRTSSPPLRSVHLRHGMSIFEVKPCLSRPSSSVSCPKRRHSASASFGFIWLVRTLVRRSGPGSTPYKTGTAAQHATKDQKTSSQKTTHTTSPDPSRTPQIGT